MRLALYVMFVLLAAPCDILMDWWGGISIPNREMFLQPITNALIYIYAFVISAEALFRLSHHRTGRQSGAQRNLVVILAIITIFWFIVDYVATLRPQIWQGQAVVGSWWRQAMVAAFAIFASILSFRISDRPKFLRKAKADVVR